MNLIREKDMFAEITKMRRSIRKFKPRQVEKDKIDTIIEAALRSPSGRAARPWFFVVVTDRGLLEKLSFLKPSGAQFLHDAPLGIVVCGDPSKSHLWIEDCTIAAVTMQYAAHSLGLGSRWAHVRGNKYNENQASKEYIAKLINLPDTLEIECIIAIGYPDEEMIPYKREELASENVSYR